MSSSLPESGRSTVPADRSSAPVSGSFPAVSFPAVSFPAVVFDLGNVLIDWDAHAAISRGVGADRARAFLADASFDFHGWNTLQDAGRTWEDAERAAIGQHPHYRSEILAYREHFDHSLVGPIDGAVHILRELHAAQVPLFALTNWSRELFPVALARFDFLQMFGDIVVSGQEAVAKPDPQIFRVLADRMQQVGGLQGAVFVDDRLENVHAATLAGMDGVQFTEPGELRTALAQRGLPVQEV